MSELSNGRATGSRSHYVFDNGRAPINTFSTSGAFEIADRIRSYWAERGCKVELIVGSESIGGNMYGRFPRIRSNLVDGVPPRMQTPSQRAKGERALLPPERRAKTEDEE
jgi:hypothetical protein